MVLDEKSHDLTKRRNEIWGGIPRSSFFATFAFFAAKTDEGHTPRNARFTGLSAISTR